MDQESAKISVIIRIRPKIEKLGEKYEVECVGKINDTSLYLQTTAADSKKKYTYQFDDIFDQESTQEELYSEKCLDLLDYCLMGYDVTVFSYGQTGSGKTFTVLGEVGKNTLICEKSGIFLRLLRDIFKYKEMNQKVTLRVKVSILEIYLENFRDLLAAEAKKLNFHETEDDIKIEDLTEVQVDSLVEVLTLYRKAEKNRITATTSMNDVSSRSHACFFMGIEQEDNDTHKISKSNFCIVDLAGSERVKKSDVGGIHMKEAQFINKSLSALGNVVNGLYEGKQHIPFRDSKLTRMLKPAFCGKGKILMIANLSPTLSSMNESLSTLRFADRVKQMKVAVNLNEASDIDPKFQEQYLELMKKNEEMISRIEIAKSIYGYEQQLNPLQVEQMGPEIKNFLVQKANELSNTFKDMKLKRLEDAKSKMISNIQLEYMNLEKSKEKDIENAQNKLKELEGDHETQTQALADVETEMREKSSKLVDLIESLTKDNVTESERNQSLKQQSEEENNKKKISSTKYFEAQKRLQDFKKQFLVKQEKEKQEGTDQPAALDPFQIYRNENEQKQELLDKLISIRELQESYMEELKKTNLVKRNTRTGTKKIEIFEIFTESTAIFENCLDKAMKLVVEKEKVSQELKSVNEVLNKSYPHDLPDIHFKILHYLISGSNVTKYCSSKKHNVTLFISKTFDMLCWRHDTEQMKYIEISQISKITLGQYSERVLIHTPKRTRFFNTFSLTIAGFEKAIDIETSNPFDIEAWIIGLSMLTNIKPDFGGKLSDDPTILQMRKSDLQYFYSQLSLEEERQCCEKNFIDPRLILKLKPLLIPLLNATSSDGTPKSKKASRGQLRALTDLEVFRSDALYRIIYDEEPRLPTWRTLDELRNSFKAWRDSQKR